MSIVDHALREVQKTVVCFDICSSTTILEDLILSTNQSSWRNLLIKLKEFLQKKRDSLGFEIYKFTGDGWILLFNADSKGELISFLQELCDHFSELFRQRIATKLSSVVSPIGITIGIDRGRLIEVTMDQHREYIGRPINIACRLQNAVKDNDNEPQWKALMSQDVYHHLKASIPTKLKTKLTRRVLRNVNGGREYRATVLHLVNPKAKS